MAEIENKALWLQSSPHIVKGDDTTHIMSRVVISLLPVTAFGICIFGISALLNVVVSVAAAVVGEALFRRITKQDIRVKDCSAVVTGLLLALVIPPATPLWMTALGSLFAIVVAKEFFGGLGANVFNPALAGRAFLLMSFPAAATTWLKPEGIKTPFYQLSGAVDGVTMSTPLGFIKEGISTGKISDWKAGVAALASNMHLSSTADVYKDLFLGNRSGSIGETSILLILIGGLFLFFTKTIDWRTPVSMLVSAAVLSCLLGFDPIVALLSGGLVFGAVFMATDYSSTPLTSTGKVIFGIGAGIITVLVRKFGNYPEGVMYSILIMNMATPFLNKLTHKKYGFVAVKKAAK